MSGFVKLYSSILHSSLWVDSDPAVKVVWIALLAMADRKGEVKASLPGIAHAAVVPLSEAQRALAIFEAPDEHSRSPEHEGRRVESIPGGWRILNHTKYREMESESAERVRAHRERKGGALHVTDCNDVTAEAEANAKAEAKAKRNQEGRARAEDFDAWWVAYPKKLAKDAARRAWLGRLKDLPPLKDLLSILALQRCTLQWKADGGRFVPNGSTYLNQGRWSDDVSTYPQGAAANDQPKSHTRGGFHAAGVLQPVNVIRPSLPAKKDTAA